MTIQEFRKLEAYNNAIEKIKSYSKGFTFTIHYADIPKAKANDLRIVLNDCIKMGLLESIRIGLDIHGDFVEEEYKRL